MKTSRFRSFLVVLWWRFGIRPVTDTEFCFVKVVDFACIIKNASTKIQLFFKIVFCTGRRLYHILNLLLNSKSKLSLQFMSSFYDQFIVLICHVPLVSEFRDRVFSSFRRAISSQFVINF